MEQQNNDITDPPWRWLTNRTLIQGSDGFRVVLMAGICPVTREPEMKVRGPNGGPVVTMNVDGSVAKLIEAAPDLLAELRRLTDWLYIDQVIGGEMSPDHLDKAFALIERIDGRPPPPPAESDA